MNDLPPDFGINFYGHVSGNFGLAVAAKNTLRALVSHEVPVDVIDIDAGSGRSGRDDEFAHLYTNDPAGRYPVSLFHTNPTDVYSYAVDVPARIWEPDRYRVLVPFWELPLIPPGLWTDFISSMDLVLAPTRFISDAVRATCPDTPVVHYPQAVFLPEGVAPNRARFGLPEGAFVCLAVMDASSGFERKNPLASVDAFRQAFDGKTADEVRLVVKMNDRRGAQLYSQQIDEFRRDAEADPRIMVIEESMPYQDVLSLNASADVLLSLHRSEGLGLNLMEAMSLGTVVVATAWSGNMDFTTEENSVLVPWSRTEVRCSHPAYGPSRIGEGQWWAEPDTARAALELRKLYESPSRWNTMAGRAQEAMDARRAEFMRDDVSASIEAIRQSDTSLATRHAERSRLFQRTLRVGALRRAQRLAGRVQRGLRGS